LKEEKKNYGTVMYPRHIITLMFKSLIE